MRNRKFPNHNKILLKFVCKDNEYAVKTRPKAPLKHRRLKIIDKINYL